MIGGWSAKSFHVFFCSVDVGMRSITVNNENSGCVVPVDLNELWREVNRRAKIISSDEQLVNLRASVFP